MSASITPTIGVFSPGDPRLPEDDRQRCRNIVESVANKLRDRILLPRGVYDESYARVIHSSTLVDGAPEADLVAKLFRENHVGAVVCVCDTWAFPQPTTLNLLSNFPPGTPINITCGNSAPRPGVVYAQATNGALAQSGILAHLNVGSWPDLGQNPEMDEWTTEALMNWCYAAATYIGMRGKRVMLVGTDSMGMETALAHVEATRRTFGLEIERPDMKLIADMLGKVEYSSSEADALETWLRDNLGDRLETRVQEDNVRFRQQLGIYLVLQRCMDQINAIGGGFKAQLDWGSDLRGMPLPTPDIAESLLNSTFDHRGVKPVRPFATEADCQALITMLILSWLMGGDPPLFMDFRKIWDAMELHAKMRETKIEHDYDRFPPNPDWYNRGLFDGCNSGSASLDWAAKPGASVEEIMDRVSMPLADESYFPGLGNSISYITPGGISGVVARLAYSSLSGQFSFVWDEATTAELPAELARKLAEASTPGWPHTFVTPDHASTDELKQTIPANHIHMVWGLPPARLQYFLDLVNVHSITPWEARPQVAKEDRPLPLIYHLLGGEYNAKLMLAGRR